MSIAITLVRLRWALTLAALRKSVWQTVAYVLSAIFAAGTIIGTGILAWFVGMLPPSTMDSDGYPFNILGRAASSTWSPCWSVRQSPYSSV